MTDKLKFNNQVAIVTGAAEGLGRIYALLLASHGVRVVVNDFGGIISGKGPNEKAVDLVVQEIKDGGGIAIADYNSVEDGDKIVQTALSKFEQIDILVNNAGSLQDSSLAQMSDTDWDLANNVHFHNSFVITRAVWPFMKLKKYGRIIMASCVTGIYGNFGQGNYSASNLKLASFSNVVAIEGLKYGIHCNTIAPMKELFDELKPDLVAPMVVWLCHSDCADTGGLFEAGSGWYGKYCWGRRNDASCRTKLGPKVTPDDVRKKWAKITSFEDDETDGFISQMRERVIQTQQQHTNPQVILDPKEKLLTVVKIFKEFDGRLRRDAAKNKGIIYEWHITLDDKISSDWILDWAGHPASIHKKDSNIKSNFTFTLPFEDLVKLSDEQLIPSQVDFKDHQGLEVNQSTGNPFANFMELIKKKPKPNRKGRNPSTRPGRNTSSYMRRHMGVKGNSKM